MTLAAAIKLGATCMSLLSPDVLFCRVDGVVMVCQRSGCVTPDELTETWRKHPERRAAFIDKLYGNDR